MAQNGKVARSIVLGMLATGALTFGGWWVLSGETPPRSGAPNAELLTEDT